MKAWRLHELGEPRDVLRFEAVPDPEPGPRQVLVEVLAVPANFPDVLLCQGRYQVQPPLPMTPGVELCGRVVAVGEGVKRLAVGDRVIGHPNLPAGGFAEYAVLDEENVLPAPAALGDSAASTLTIAYQTGWFALHRRARIRTGETLLVHAAAGGVGSAAVQLGRAAGARVIGVVGGSWKAAYCRELGTDLGADLVVDRLEADFVPAVKEFTEGRGVDVVFDPVGGEAFTRSTKCIAFEGRIVVIGFTSGSIPAARLDHLLVKNYSVLGLHWGLYRQHDRRAVDDCHAELCRLAEAGSIVPPVTEELPLDAVPDGLERLGRGDTMGRIVFTPRSERTA